MPRPTNPPTKYPYIRLPDGWDATWRAARAAAAINPCWITCFGDSVFNGVNQASAYLKTVQELLIAQLLAATGLPRYADYWPAMQSTVWSCPADTPWGPALNGATFAAFEAGFHKSHYCNNLNNIATTFHRFTSPYACTAMDIVYVDYNAGVWAYSLDGGTAVNVTNTGAATPATASVKKISLTGLSNTTHTIDFRQTTSGTVLFGGVTTYANPTGIGMVRMSCSGQRGNDYVTGTTYPADRMRLHMGVSPQSDAGTGKAWGFPHGPSLLILGLGINDCNSSDPNINLEQFYNRLIHAVRALSPNCSILIWVPHYPYSVTSDSSTGYANQEAYRQYQNEMYNVANYWGAAIVNNNWKWGETPFAQGLLPATDIHPKDAGHADIANTLLSVL
jgi:hypothetical protein